MLGFIIAMVIIGIIAGYLGRLLVPGPDPMSVVGTIVLGIAGSFVGGSLATLLNVSFYGWLGNFLVATVGAILILWLWRRFRGPSY